MTLREKAIEAAARVIDDADVGYSMQLTRLVDGESTYALTYSDGAPTLEFDSTDDAYAHISQRKYRAKAEAAFSAILSIIAEPDEAMCRIGADNLFGSSSVNWDDDAAMIWKAMIRKLQEV